MPARCLGSAQHDVLFRVQYLRRMSFSPADISPLTLLREHWGHTAFRPGQEEIIRLLNHPVITRPEKTKMLLNINRLDEERAIQSIAKLRKAIDDRENGEKAAA